MPGYCPLPEILCRHLICFGWSFWIRRGKTKDSSFPPKGILARKPREVVEGAFVTVNDLDITYCATFPILFLSLYLADVRWLFYVHDSCYGLPILSLQWPWAEGRYYNELSLRDKETES